MSESSKITVLLALNLNNLFTILVLSLDSQLSLLSPLVNSGLYLSQHWLIQLLAIAVYWEAIKFLNENSNYIDKLSSVYSLDWTALFYSLLCQYSLCHDITPVHK